MIVRGTGREVWGVAVADAGAVVGQASCRGAQYGGGWVPGVSIGAGDDDCGRALPCDLGREVMVADVDRGGEPGTQNEQ